MNAKSKYNNLKFRRQLREQFYEALPLFEIVNLQRLNPEKVTKKLKSTESYPLMFGLFELGWASSLIHAKKLITSGKVSLNGFKVRDAKRVLQPLDVVRLTKSMPQSSRQFLLRHHVLFVADHATSTAIYVGVC